MSRKYLTVTLALLAVLNFLLIIMFGWPTARFLSKENSTPGVVQEDYNIFQPHRKQLYDTINVTTFTDELSGLNDTMQHIETLLISYHQSYEHNLEVIDNSQRRNEELLVKIVANISNTYKELQHRNQHNISTNSILENNITDIVNSQSQAKARVNVLLMASMRTGSSFLGEMFRQHPDYLYIFEPPRGLRLKDYDPMLTVNGVQMLTDIYNCDFTSPFSKPLLDNLFNPVVSLARRNVVPAWVNEKYCSGWNDQFKIYTKCSPMSPSMASESCRSFKGVVAKVIRIYDIYPWFHLMMNSTVNLKVVNLIRDPRGVIASVIPVHIKQYASQINKQDIDIQLEEKHFDDALSRRLSLYCSTMLRNVLVSKHAKWLPEENYMAIRYEDMAENPTKAANTIFNFLGTDVHDNVKRWIKENTNYTDGSNSPYYAWETKRNSKEVSQKWRQKMTYGLAKKIEDTGDCSHLLETVGYRKVENPKQLKDPAVSFVLSKPSWLNVPTTH
ncbi:carbohydrate sulfotransferase 1-like [Saccoglossus kowalevskii]|uniref:Carbohydrate sulfotransferase 1-like n=1 Tax=Saccoglossus kowalevskii TaxID=10224 RepID=A0ABM0MZ91_SACKO|nr:PREDICTED: carbohydrate sulfotransferase 1-like [Saccoglossus kowalevskii]